MTPRACIFRGLTLLQITWQFLSFSKEMFRSRSPADVVHHSNLQKNLSVFCPELCILAPETCHLQYHQQMWVCVAPYHWWQPTICWAVRELAKVCQNLWEEMPSHLSADSRSGSPDCLHGRMHMHILRYAFRAFYSLILSVAVALHQINSPTLRYQCPHGSASSKVANTYRNCL